MVSPLRLGTIRRDFKTKIEVLIMIELIFLTGIILITLIARRSYQSESHGTAIVKTRSHLLKSRNKGLIINGRKSISVNNSLMHAMISAPTGAGKTTGYILNNLIGLSGSKVILDIKGELIRLTSGFLEKTGYKVRIIDLSNVLKSLRFNPLKRLKSDIDTRKFAALIMEMNSNGKEDKFWSSGGQNIIEIVVRCLVNMRDETYMNMANLIHIISNIDINNNCQSLEPFVAMFGRRGQNRDVIEMFNRFRLQEEKIKAGWLASAMSALSHFDNEQMRLLMAQDELDFSELRKKKTVIYIKIPAGMISTYAPFLQLFYTQLFDELLSTRLEKGDQNIFALLDEFGVAGKLPNFSEVSSLIRSQGVSLSLICQSLQQLEDTYGKSDANTIIGNCANHLILPGIMDTKTLLYYEKLLGVETSQEWDEYSQRMQINRRSLFNPDEIRRLRKNEAIFLHGNADPVKLRMYPLFKNAYLMGKAKIRSKDKQLIPTIPPVQQEVRNVGQPSLLNLDHLREWIHKQTNAQTRSNPTDPLATKSL